MKMENPILATVAGQVQEISVTPGQQVKSGQVLAVIEY
jgi:biotin carboxyl carrier protein